mmetsp:Transcript_3172/g.10424  ORF Transcript_3172/g.10424 Transcript_3172/m.10424 type:complete len:287 (-) Transcript_3172:2116-2976(-)
MDVPLGPHAVGRALNVAARPVVAHNALALTKLVVAKRVVARLLTLDAAGRRHNVVAELEAVPMKDLFPLSTEHTVNDEVQLATECTRTNIKATAAAHRVGVERTGDRKANRQQVKDNLDTHRQNVYTSVGQQGIHEPCGKICLCHRLHQAVERRATLCLSYHKSVPVVEADATVQLELEAKVAHAVDGHVGVRVVPKGDVRQLLVRDGIAHGVVGLARLLAVALGFEAAIGTVGVGARVDIVRSRPDGKVDGHGEGHAPLDDLPLTRLSDEGALGVGSDELYLGSL